MNKKRIVWGAIMGIAASIAVCIQTLPTIGMYWNHIAAVWRCPEQLSTIQNVASNQVVQQQQLESMSQDVRDIKWFLYRGNAPIVATVKTNLIGQ